MLNRIHEGTLDLIEDNNAEEKEDHHKGETIAKGGPGEIALAQGSVLEGLDDGGHRVEHNQRAESAFWYHTDRIDDGGGVHP